MNINLREQARYRRENEELTENCEFVTGLKRQADYFSVFYKNNKTFGISLTCDDNNQLTLMLSVNSSIANSWAGFYFKKVINNPNAKLQLFSGYSSGQNFEHSVADEDFSIVDAVQVDNTVYHNVLVIKSTISKEEGGKNAINKFYIDPFVGVIRFEMNNGEIWSIE